MSAHNIWKNYDVVLQVMKYLDLEALDNLRLQNSTCYASAFDECKRRCLIFQSHLVEPYWVNEAGEYADPHYFPSSTCESCGAHDITYPCATSWTTEVGVCLKCYLTPEYRLLSQKDVEELHFPGETEYNVMDVYGFDTIIREKIIQELSVEVFGSYPPTYRLSEEMERTFTLTAYDLEWDNERDIINEVFRRTLKGKSDLCIQKYELHALPTSL
jgi:hypothetical protein